jgi:DNA-binding MarR family transcriptional regulator
VARQRERASPGATAEGGDPGLDQASYEALAGFRYELRKFMAFSRRAAETAGLKPQQYQALLAIKAYAGPEAISPKELAENLFIGLSTAVELVDRLEASGLVRREPSVRDRRRTLLRLTPRSEQALASLAAVHRDELREQVPAMISLLSRIQGQALD